MADALPGLPTPAPDAANEDIEVFMPYQRDFLVDESPFRVIEKSRRVGISWCIGSTSVLDAAEIDGCDTWYIGYNKDMSREFIRDCEQWLKSLSIAASAIGESIFEENEDPAKSVLAFTITLPSGYRITALSSRPTNLRAKKGHIIIDEGAFHPDLPGLLKAAIAVLMWGGRVTVISTHNGVDNPFAKLCEEIRSGKRKGSLHRVTLSDALAQGLYRRICLMTDRTWTAESEAEWVAELRSFYGEDAEEELDVIPSKSGGTYIARPVITRAMRGGTVLRLAVPDDFVTWDEDLRVAHVDQWLEEEALPALDKLPKNFLHFMGEDFGRVSDRTVLCIGHLDQQVNRRFTLAVELLNVPFEQQKQVAFYVIDRLPRFFKAAFDATGNGAYLAEVCMQRYGAQHIERVDLSAKWYAENLPPMKAALEQGTMTVINDTDHMTDLSAFKRIDGLPKLPPAKTDSTSGPKRHGDAGVAYALGHYASCLPIAEYDYESTTAKNEASNAGRGSLDPRRRDHDDDDEPSGGFHRSRGIL